MKIFAHFTHYHQNFLEMPLFIVYMYVPDHVIFKPYEINPLMIMIFSFSWKLLYHDVSFSAKAQDLIAASCSNLEFLTGFLSDVSCINMKSCNGNTHAKKRLNTPPPPTHTQTRNKVLSVSSLALPLPTYKITWFIMKGDMVLTISS